jgi:hypothetical protein
LVTIPTDIQLDSEIWKYYHKDKKVEMRLFLTISGYTRLVEGSYGETNKILEEADTGNENMQSMKKKRDVDFVLFFITFVFLLFSKQ